MKQTTVIEISKALNVTKTSVLRRAKKESWAFEEQVIKGGKAKLFTVEELPRDVQMALARGQIKEQLPVAQEAQPKACPLPAGTSAQRKKALYKADLLRLYVHALEKAAWGEKVQARDSFVSAYNSGLAWPHLFEQLGALSWKTIESWKCLMEANNNDCFCLIDQRGSHRRGETSLGDEHATILLRCVLRPNQPKISEAIRTTRAILRHKNIPDGPSDATFRRWLENWRSINNAVWVWAREGAKAWNDQCAMYIERDYDLLDVGDVIVADGHNLNFEIINPWTGKPQNHMTLILFFDMKSNQPLGWEIMPTENTAAISSALRRSILRLGKYPRVVYLDNGRAFKSRFFKGSQDFSEAGFSGLYSRLGCDVIHAWPYHGQSKTVERFFGTFAELERLVPNYTGTSIEAKPPRMMRGERRHRALHEQQFGGKYLSIEQAHILIAAWFDAYSQRPQRGHMEGACPAEIFAAGQGPGVDKAELNWLMMSMEVKTIHRNGISFRGRNYYAPALYGRKHKVLIRYDLQDDSSILVEDPDGTLICEAYPQMKVHPAASQLGSETDRKLLGQHIELKRQQEKQAAITASEFLRNEVLPEHQRQLAALGINDTPAIEAPKSNIVSIDMVKAKREAAEAIQASKDFAAEQLRRELMDLSNADRYERLIEMDAQGVALAEEWVGFMAYYERTDEYERFSSYWEERRNTYGLMYRASAATTTTGD